MKRLVSISCEVDLLYSNGFYYVAIPECVVPDPYECCGRCVALDSGLKAFMTGVDLEGNILEFGRDNKFRLNEVRHRASAVQHVMSKFKNRKGKSKRWQYRAFAKAKRTFTSCVAKLKNLVKDLHYKTCANLTEHYDAILLPIFKTKGMVRRSSARTHGFNTSILCLNHFKFCLLLDAAFCMNSRIFDWL
jgi:transposase